jgi:hypothetical protein
MLTAEPELRIELDVRISYHVFFIYDEANRDDPASETAEDAIDNADGSDLQVGSADGLVVLSTPVQWNTAAPLRVETWPGEPADDSANWDHVVDIDLDAPTGQLRFRESGPTETERGCEVPKGSYRARLAGRGYDQASSQGGGLDSYRVQLWPRTSDSGPALRKHWRGWGKRASASSVS